MIYYCGIDNGVSGSVAIVCSNGAWSQVVSMPVFSEQDYTRKKQNVTRIDTSKLRGWLIEAMRDLDLHNSSSLDGIRSIRLVMERPMINPMRFRATMSAIRAWEATLIVLAEFPWPRIVVDSRGWQKAMLPAGCKGPELKVASVQVGCRLFPDHQDWIQDQGDADALLLAEFARRNKL